MKNKLLHVLNDIFSVVFFLLFLLAVKPELIYHSQQLGFATSKAFFAQYASYPGGMVEYLSLFLFQFYSNAFWGALIVSLLLSTTVAISGFILAKGSSFLNGFLKYIPVVLLGILLTGYSIHPVFLLMVLFLFGFFILFKLIVDSKLSIIAQLVLLLLILALCYYINGGFIFLILSTTAILYLLVNRIKGFPVIAVLIIGLYLLLPYWSQSLFFITTKDAYLKLVPYFSAYRPDILLYGSIFSLPFMILIQRIVSWMMKKEKSQTSKFIFSDRFQAIQVLVMMVILVVGMFVKIDPTDKQRQQINDLAYQNKWDELLTKVSKEGYKDRIVQFQVNRALYHKGQLIDKVFDYPQIWGVDALILSRHFEEPIMLPITELYMDLGFINGAIRYGNEALSQNEFSPYVLEQLILANIVANRPKAAQIYINNLKMNPFFKKKALTYEQYINGSVVSDIDQFVVAKRKIKPVNDFIVNSNYPQDVLLSMLNDRPQNKMAYEYLMTYFLMNNDLSSFISNYSKGKDLGYKEFPVIFEEAKILYAYELSAKGKSLANVKFKKEIAERFKEYLSILSSCNGDVAKAKPLLEKNFSDTYWYYVHYNSPVTNQSKIVNE
ncbi:MAG TPA: DUF6057 family protein [Prolixibacteraceae bacterium]|nr:DUF6057 family protein [Prolixibacteraceae bacterium]